MLSSVLKACVAALLFARLLVPTELPQEGRTLWIVQLWLGVGLIWAWDRFREGDLRIRFSRVDAMLWIVVAGHALSALAVFVNGGHERYAINATWEWVGLGVSLFLMRQVIRTVADRSALLLTMLAAAVAMSALGMWQHYVFYPNAARQYQQLRSELAELENAPVSQNDAARQQRLVQLRRQMAQDGVPSDDPSRKLWEQRLRSSTEPMGPFALANTFAGWLAVWIVVGLGGLWSALRRDGPVWKLIGPALLSTFVAYCLLLTKSRTAWIGLMAGLACWAAWSLRPGSKKLRAGLAVAGVVLLVGGMLALATLSGGFDLAVISEAPKSLEYRLQYWGSSWQLVGDHPLAGVGPGNFRQHYVKYKLPESSEEIADPHNLVLDLWINGGVVALLGFVGFVVVAGRAMKRRNERPPPASTTFTRSILFGSGVSFGLVSGYEFLLGDGADPRLPVLLVVWLLALFLLRPISNARAMPGVCWLAAGATLLVHLLGAGGVEMPAILQVFLVVAVLGTEIEDETEVSHPASEAQSRLPTVAAFAVVLALFVGCLFSATKMVIGREISLRSGRLAVMEGNTIRGERLLMQAAESDPFSPEPHVYRAAMAYQSWLRSATPLPEQFDAAVAAQRSAIERDPHHFNLYAALGTWYLAKFRRERQSNDALQAVDAFASAVELYPNQVGLRADFAQALSAAGRADRAAEEAEFALRLDEINHREGHQDKYLAAEDLEMLGRIADRNRADDVR